MNAKGALDRLCEHLGIAPDYADIWGERHIVPEATRRSLLAAMGVDAADDGAAERSLDTLLDGVWRRRIPPAQVVWEDQDGLDLDLRIPDAWSAETLHWVLEEEGGARREGDLTPTQWEVRETRRLDGAVWTHRRIRLPTPSAVGYHRLALGWPGRPEAPPAHLGLISAPSRCYTPEAIRSQQGCWGLTVQLHAVRSGRNWGIGDYTDLVRLVELAASEGADLLGIAPVHALFPLEPERCDPYGPSSRRFLNPLHLDLEAIPDLSECAEAGQTVADAVFQARLRALRTAALVDYRALWQLKLPLLERLYRHFDENHIRVGSERARGFQRFEQEQGAALYRLSVFEALQERFAGEDGVARPWQEWPEPYRNPDSEAVQRFAADRAERVRFFRYLQWQTHLQLEAAGRRSWELGLGVGLYQDLAVGVAPDGADAWSGQGLYAADARIGAPPDDFSLAGQDWGVLPFVPEALREVAYAPFVAALRANMQHAGALRIDHAMGLLRLFWIPKGGTPKDGAYVYYPFRDLLGVLALESQRNRCLVIGEDLGTVPDEVRQALKPLDVLSSRLLLFERIGDGAFRPPAEYEPAAAVAASTHDLPTLAGFWVGGDLESRHRLGLFPAETDYQEQLVRRARDRALLLLALDREGLLPEGTGADPVTIPRLTADLMRAIHLYLARSPARVLLVQAADLLAEEEQTNLPGAGNAYPSWQGRLSLELEAWGAQPVIGALLEAVRRARSPGAAPSRYEGSGPEVLAVPRATYRLQLHGGFGFRDAAETVPYLAGLGVSHCYLSPYFKARPGSTHGYDVVDHNSINPELGTAEDFEYLCGTLATHGMGQILDLVPNHVGVMGRENAAWLDVLENGPASRFSAHFDIDWEPLKEELRGKVLLPILGDRYGNVLDRGEIRVSRERGAFFVDYFEYRLPVDPGEYPQILAPGIERLEVRLGGESPAMLAWASLLTALGNLPPRSDTTEEGVAARTRDKELLKERLRTLCAEHPDLDWSVQECLRELNGDDRYPPDSARLHRLLEAQAYRLAYWRVAADEINYRRFFDIDDLAALRMERAEVFESTHRLAARLLAEGKAQGLRIDHPDGLYDPAEYFRRLRALECAVPAAPGPSAPNGESLYLAIEKILVGGERLPLHWPVQGTTGYEFAALAEGLFVKRAGKGPLTRCYEDFIGKRSDWADETCDGRRLVMKHLLSSELHVLASELSRIAEADPHTRDYTLSGLRDALMGILACFPVYRTYVGAEGVSRRDCAQIATAVREAKRRSRAPDLTVFDFVSEVLTASAGLGKPQAYRERVLRLAMKVQQYSGPVMAKGIEDTAFYRYHRLVSLNEVGGDPDRFGVCAEAFHRELQYRRRHWPHALLATSTHDSKRSEDVRARLHVLSEIPDLWERRARRWAAINRPLKARVGGRELPDPNAEYLLYQTLLGVWPYEGAKRAESTGLRQRVQGYMQKAVREAKLDTSWLDPDRDYEGALATFVGAVLDPDRNGAFMEDFLPFQRRVARAGVFNSLSLTLLKLTAPGVPDIYQGTELLDLSLVDPDNRRPVDFARRRDLLDDLKQTLGPDRLAPEGARALLNRPEDGRAKLYLIWRCLSLRREDPDLFSQGDYVPLRAHGIGADRLCAFARRRAGRWLLAVVPRLVADLGDGQWPFDHRLWEETRIEVPVGRLSNLLTGETLEATAGQDGLSLPASSVLTAFPVGLLRSRPDANL